MIQTLYTAINKGALDKAFNYCDHATSSQAATVCSAQKEEAIFKDIKRRFALFPAAFTDAQKQSYDAMLEKAFAFFDTRASSEQDLSGSLRGIFITEWERDQRIWLLDILEKLEAGTMTIERMDYQKVHEEMEKTYRELMTHKEEAYKAYLNGESNLFIRKESIESTQQDFLLFRDAFAYFGVAGYPKTRLDDWKAWIETIRTTQLKEMFGV